MLQPESNKGLVWVESGAFPPQYFWQRSLSSFGRQILFMGGGKKLEKTASLCKEPQLPCPNPVLLSSSLSLSPFIFPAVAPCNVAARVKQGPGGNQIHISGFHQDPGS